MIKDTQETWFKEAKYGLFIHWGLYSILAGEYKGKATPNIAEWILNHMNIPVEEYEKLAGQFNPKNFDAEDIVRKAKTWGMKYIVFTSKHHDGFAMFHSECNRYNIVDATPFGRDIVSELQAACLKYDMKLGIYYSQAQDWDDPNGLRDGADNTQKDFDKYLDSKCIPQLKELLTKYGEIALLWFDTPLTMTEEQSKKVVKIVKSLQPNCLINGRIGNNLGDYLTTGDNFIPLLPYNGDWEVPATLNDTWGFNKNDSNWKNPKKILNLLLKINGRGGNYLLNVGPDCNGVIPKSSIDILNTVGTYIRANTDSIVATQALDFYPYDLSWVLFTVKNHKLFLHIVEPVFHYLIHNVASTIQRSYILETGEEVPFVQKTTCSGDYSWEFFPPAAYIGKTGYVICVETVEKEVRFQRLSHWDFNL
jgi:alpha-L-fucosidase